MTLELRISKLKSDLQSLEFEKAQIEARIKTQRVLIQRAEGKIKERNSQFPPIPKHAR